MPPQLPNSTAVFTHPLNPSEASEHDLHQSDQPPGYDQLHPTVQLTNVSQSGSTHSGGPHTHAYHAAYPSIPPSYIPGLHFHTATRITDSQHLEIAAPVPVVPLRADALRLPNLDNPRHKLYQKQLEEEWRVQADEDMLTAEVLGERVAPVHGCGLWSYRYAVCPATARHPCSLNFASHSGHIAPEGEAAKQRIWREYGSRAAWLAAARARTAYYAQGGTMRPPLRWVLVEADKGQDIPEDALQTGTEADGQKLYSARAWFRGGVHLGKVLAVKY